MIAFLRPIFLANALMLGILGLFMLVPFLLDLSLQNPDWKVFLASALITLFVALMLYLSARGKTEDFSLRQGFALITFSWIAITTFGALPLTFSELELSYTDAFFEAMSGLTTTGSTVIVGLDEAPPGILLWRGILQWLGGLGIIVMAIAILPILQIGGMQLFRMEGFDTSQVTQARATQVSISIVVLYIVLSVINAILYDIAGMTTFEAVVHAMTTISTGGYSTSDGSIGYFNSPMIESITILFMIIGSLPFVLFLQVLRGRSLSPAKDSQVFWFLTSLLTFILVLALYQVEKNGTAWLQAIRSSAFNVTSVMTGTGYASEDYNLWGPFSTVALFCILFVGGCAGSTTCGLKIFRFQVIFAGLSVQIKRMIHPHGVFFPRFNGRKIEERVVSSVASYFFLFFVSFAVLAFCLSLVGLDHVTALSAAGTTISNVGPGLGDTIGPAGNFKPLPDTAKWLLSAGMLLGRIEIFSVLVLFTPGFWRG